MPLPALFRDKPLSGLRLPALFSRSRQPLVYEVDLRVDAGDIDDFDAWLKTHMREMLAFPGFQEAEAFVAQELDESGRHRRVVTYLVRSKRELDSYLHTHARRMRAEGKMRFGASLAASRRILPQGSYALPDGLQQLYSTDDISGGLPVCSNCHQPVPGQFCASCGQEDRTYLLSLRELVLDFFGDLINFDSRFFKTTLPLLFRPGYLTAEYTRGRRQAYFPPVRLYIFISIVFFFVAAIMTDASVDKLGDDIFLNSRSAPETIEEGEDRIRKSLARKREQLREAGLFEEAQAFLPDEEKLIADMKKRKEAADVSGQLPTETATVNGEETARTEPDGNTGVTVTGIGIPEFDERLERGAEQVRKNPKAFWRNLVDDIPAMMFLFLPVIALVLKVLYFFTGRYYVEHLIFTLHYHAAVFVLMLLLMVNAELEAAYAFWKQISGWVSLIIWIYLPVYLYRSMRVVYGQGHFMTASKFMLLGFAYVFAAALTLAATVVLGVWQQG